MVYFSSYESVMNKAFTQALKRINAEQELQIRKDKYNKKMLKRGQK